MRTEEEIKELEDVNIKLKTFQTELDNQIDDMLRKYKGLKEGLFAFLEIEKENAQTLIEATEEHDVVKFNTSSREVDNMSLVWSEHQKQKGKIELLALLEKEYETVFKVADAGDSDEVDLEAK